MVEHGRRERVARSAKVITQGDPIDHLYIVLRGAFAVSDRKLGGRELARLSSGEIVGEMSLIESRPASASVTAIEDGVVFALPRGKIEQKLKSDLGFAARFYRALAVFLSDRVRSTVRTLGYGAPAESALEEEDQPDELDMNVLDKVHLAGQRFDDILKRLGGD